MHSAALSTQDECLFRFFRFNFGNSSVLMYRDLYIHTGHSRTCVPWWYLQSDFSYLGWLTVQTLHIYCDSLFCNVGDLYLLTLFVYRYLNTTFNICTYICNCRTWSIIDGFLVRVRLSWLRYYFFAGIDKIAPIKIFLVIPPISIFMLILRKLVYVHTYAYKYTRTYHYPITNYKKSILCVCLKFFIRCVLS